MNILFVVSKLTIAPPIGVLQLSAILKKNNYKTGLLDLSRHSIDNTLKLFCPDVIAYSVSSPDLKIFESADINIKTWINNSKKQVLRIMGGAHPTYFPQIVDEINLDAICIGEGDNAILEILRRFEKKISLSGIPNVLIAGEKVKNMKKEIISDLDLLPFIDRDIYYNSVPMFRHLAMHVVMAGRGCPYNCTYCHNHAFNKFFQGCGKIVRKRSVSNVIEELKIIVNKYSRVKLIRFADDTFAHQVDGWLLEFLARYKKEIGLPFYCIMRSNVFSEEMAKQLSNAGCISIAMSVESGDEVIRNKVLKRHLSNKTIIKSFEYARKYNIKTFGNAMFAIPGSTYNDDFNTFLFVKKLKLTLPTFGIICLFPETELREYAEKAGYIAHGIDFDGSPGEKSKLNCFSDDTKNRQIRLLYLGTLFCYLPDFCIPILKILVRLPLSPVYRLFWSVYMIILAGVFIFPGIYPVNPMKLLLIFHESFLLVFLPKTKINN